MESEIDKYTFKCEKCNFGTHYKQAFDRHNLTGKHINGHITRISKIPSELSCTICNNYKTDNTFNLQIHKLNNHSSQSERKEKYKYYCEICDFGVFSEASINNHIKTKKHLKNIELSFRNPFD
jgi:hypothetical protein